jgi:hypothetical protein
MLAQHSNSSNVIMVQGRRVQHADSTSDQETIFPVGEHSPIPADFFQYKAGFKFFTFQKPLTVDQQEAVFGAFGVNQH